MITKINRLFHYVYWSRPKISYQKNKHFSDNIITCNQHWFDKYFERKRAEGRKKKKRNLAKMVES